MRIGIDFDNTIACYDGVFHRAALERGLIPSDLPAGKNSVRDFLNGSGRRDAFTELQGYVYGARMDLAVPCPGAREFVLAGRAAGHRIFIVSHKTRYPMLGPKYDLHASALKFLDEHRFVGSDAVSSGDIFLEPRREEKVARIAALGCQVFIDDLPDVLACPRLPAGMRAILFDPGHDFGAAPFETHCDWARIAAAVLSPERQHHAAG